MIEDILKSAEERMQKSVQAFQTELTKIRTGRAHPSLLDQIKVSYYGNDVPLNQVASVSIGDPQTILVAPWEKSMVSVIDKAIRESDLGLNPAISGQSIRVPLPPMTEERRKELVKVIRQAAENMRVAIRQIRRDANTQSKDLLKNKSISEDDAHRAEDRTQKLTDTYIEKIDGLLAKKEADILKV